MKILHLFSTIALNNAVFLLQAQKGSFDTRLILKDLDCKTGTAHVQVQVRAPNDAQAFRMGDANYRFEYKAYQIHNPIITSQDNFSSIADQRDKDYAAQNLQGSRVVAEKGIISLNTFYTGGNSNAKWVKKDWMPVSTLSFEVKDFQKPIELTWHDDKSFPVTGMNQVSVYRDDPAEFEYELKSVSSGIFNNLTFKASDVCHFKAPVVATAPILTKKNMVIERVYPIFDTDEDDEHTVTLINVNVGKATPSVVRGNLCLKYIPVTDFIGTDEVTVEIRDKYGLTERVSVAIRVKEDALVVYNALSPNDDGLNDNFKIEGLEKYPKNQIAIFDAKGREVFKANDYKNNWDGKCVGKLLPDGTYFYVLDDGTGQSYTGYVQLER
jgi:gliding motility-associated-like protein